MMEIKEPEIEWEEQEEEDVKVNEIPDELKYNPYEFIKKNYESIYPCIGSKVFSVLSLVPISLIIPKYIINGRKIRSHINLLWLSPPGHCKSEISKQFYNISFNPIMSKNMSAPRLYYEFKSRKGKKISLIVEDIAIWFMDEEKIKFLEGASGEEETYSREHMKNIKDGMDKHVDVVCFCSGTPENIANRRLKEGILRRFYPIIITLTKNEHKNVLNYQNNGLGKKSNEQNSDIIANFYNELFKIQNNENKHIKPIVDYVFPENIKSEAIRFFEPLGVKLHEKYGVNTATENEEFFRFMICSAFLRIFDKDRKKLIKDNCLIIDEKDLEIAKKLIKAEFMTKHFIYFSIDKIDVDGVNTRKSLKLWNEQRQKLGFKELPEEVKFLMNSNVKK